MSPCRLGPVSKGVPDRGSRIWGEVVSSSPDCGMKKNDPPKKGNLKWNYASISLLSQLSHRGSHNPPHLSRSPLIPLHFSWHHQSHCITSPLSLCTLCVPCHFFSLSPRHHSVHNLSTTIPPIVTSSPFRVLSHRLFLPLSWQRLKCASALTQQHLVPPSGWQLPSFWNPCGDTSTSHPPVAGTPLDCAGLLMVMH